MTDNVTLSGPVAALANALRSKGGGDAFLFVLEPGVEVLMVPVRTSIPAPDPGDRVTLVMGMGVHGESSEDPTLMIAVECTKVFMFAKSMVDSGMATLPSGRVANDGDIPYMLFNTIPPWIVDTCLSERAELLTMSFLQPDGNSRQFSAEDVSIWQAEQMASLQVKH